MPTVGPTLAWSSRPASAPRSIHATTTAHSEIIRQARLRQVRLHDLRHTAASVLLAQGVPARVIMEILGRSQISVTLNIHAHVAPEIAREAATRLEGALWSSE
ncbi:tyrosine-type recombinase/integrase [Micromonospora kangleipakensis]|uniref:tyrosine-type recombinase/integrase n=1 Tax=Micromonospora kangleipakensis TaxID=1077942 RepID=UPI0010295A86|nr:tyrosine-type recombinase/integrase [Micromonospora kangleipakensis]